MRGKVIDSFEGNHAFLSNFFYQQIEFDGMTWITSEHAYQAAKSKAHIDRKAIQGCPTPAATKRYARATLKLQWPEFHEHKLRIMREILDVKFAVPAMRKRLDATAGCQLVEGNTWRDTFWGVCGGKGENWLGRILMDIRDEI